MGLFQTDSVGLSYSNVEAAKQWWIDTFGCKVVRVPQDWDNPLPSDVALILPGDIADTGNQRVDPLLFVMQTG